MLEHIDHVNGFQAGLGNYESRSGRGVLSIRGCLAVGLILMVAEVVKRPSRPRADPDLRGGFELITSPGNLKFGNLAVV